MSGYLYNFNFIKYSSTITYPRYKYEVYLTLTSMEEMFVFQNWNVHNGECLNQYASCSVEFPVLLTRFEVYPAKRITLNISHLYPRKMTTYFASKKIILSEFFSPSSCTLSDIYSTWKFGFHVMEKVRLCPLHLYDSQTTHRHELLAP